MLKILSFIFFMLWLSACRNDSEANVYKYSDLYYNILLIREKYPDTTTANPKVSELLKKNGYNQITFQNESFKLFENDKALFTKMIDSVRKKAEQEVKNLNIKKAE